MPRRRSCPAGPFPRTRPSPACAPWSPSHSRQFVVNVTTIDALLSRVPRVQTAPLHARLRSNLMPGDAHACHRERDAAGSHAAGNRPQDARRRRAGTRAPVRVAPGDRARAATRRRTATTARKWSSSKPAAAKLVCGGTTRTFGPDTTLVISPNVDHQIVNIGDEPLRMTAVFAMSPVEGVPDRRAAAAAAVGVVTPA